MAPEAGRAALRAPLLGRDGAEDFCRAFSGTMGELEALLDEETAHLAAGRLRQGLSREDRKAQLAAGYLLGIEHAKRNAVALARFAPQAAAALQAAQTTLRASVERNQAVVATARAVAEGLVRGVADEVARRSRPAGYGARPPSPPPTAPLVYSARL